MSNGGKMAVVGDYAASHESNAGHERRLPLPKVPVAEPFFPYDGPTSVDAANPIAYILAVIFVAIVGLFGAALMFARAENIERNYLVGGLTLLTSCVAGIMLAGLPSSAQTSATLISISLISVLGYGLGRGIDLILGPRDHTDQGTLGADLAD